MIGRLRMFHIVAGLFAIVYVTPAMPQVPPHYPGSICFTPYFWCPLQRAIPPGSACYCNGPSGQVYGRAG